MLFTPKLLAEASARSIALVTLLLITGFAQAQATSSSQLGDRQAKLSRETEDLMNKRLNSETDNLVWKDAQIFSDSTKPEKLKITIFKSENSYIQLEPKADRVLLVKGDIQHQFDIGNEYVCANYDIKIITAGRDFVVFTKECQEQIDNVGNHHQKVDYFLYDRPTGNLQSLANLDARNEGDPYPSPKPSAPKISEIDKGYMVDWDYKVEQSPKKFYSVSEHLKILQNAKEGILKCIDTKNVNGDEGDLCSDLGSMHAIGSTK